MKHLENDAFLEALIELFQCTRKKGAVILTMKRYNGSTKPVPKKKDTVALIPAPTEYMCLIRAYITGKKKNKISTVIHQKEAVKFQMAYCSLLRNNIDGLKKSKKIKKTKA